jgi:hypothetical protein
MSTPSNRSFYAAAISASTGIGTCPFTEIHTPSDAYGRPLAFEITAGNKPARKHPDPIESGP